MQILCLCAHGKATSYASALSPVPYEFGVEPVIAMHAIVFLSMVDQSAYTLFHGGAHPNFWSVALCLGTPAMAHV